MSVFEITDCYLENYWYLVLLLLFLKEFIGKWSIKYDNYYIELMAKSYFIHLSHLLKDYQFVRYLNIYNFMINWVIALGVLMGFTTVLKYFQNFQNKNMESIIWIE